MYGAFSLQGPPRFGRRAFGVPPRGAFDQESLALANALVGNDPGIPAVELGMGVLEAQVLEGFTLAVVGARAAVSLNGDRRSSNASFALREGDRIKLDSPALGARVYLAAAGGWTGALERGSPLSPASFRPVTARRLAEGPASLGNGPFRVIPGPHASRFAASAFEAAYAASNLIDRMGLRLTGPSLPQTPEIVSEPCIFGTIQVANDGQLLILGPDGPTIGGYPKLAQLATVDLDRLGQLRPGDEVRFLVVGVEPARELWRARQASLQRSCDLLRMLV